MDVEVHSAWTSAYFVPTSISHSPGALRGSGPSVSGEKSTAPLRRDFSAFNERLSTISAPCPSSLRFPALCLLSKENIVLDTNSGTAMRMPAFQFFFYFLKEC